MYFGRLDSSQSPGEGLQVKNFDQAQDFLELFKKKIIKK